MWPFRDGKADRISELEEKTQVLTDELTRVQNQSAPLSEIQSWDEFLGLSGSPSGVNVNRVTAMRHSAVYACIRILATVVGMLPCPVYRINDDGESHSKARQHPLWNIFNVSPKPGMTKPVFWEWIIANKFLTGMAYAQIVRNRAGQVQGFRPLLSHRVAPKRIDDDTNIYVYTDPAGTPHAYHQDDVLVFPCVNYDGVRAMDPITHAGRNAIGTGIAQDEFAARFFKNGAVPVGGVKYPEGKSLTADQAKTVANYVQKRTSGEEQHSPLVLANGGEYFSISLNAEQSQIMQGRAFSVGDIARLFGVPLWLLQQTEKNTSWGTGIEQMSIGAVIYTFSPLFGKLEAEINLKVFSNDPGHFIEFNADGMQRGDFKARIEALNKSLGGNQIPGLMTVNEARQRLNLPSLGPEFDVPYIPNGDEAVPIDDDDEPPIPTGDPDDE